MAAKLAILTLATLSCAAVSSGSGVVATRGASTCQVTVAKAASRPPASVPRNFDYGNASIAVALNPPNGRLVAGRLPGGGSRATVNRDGTIWAKYGWWRAGDKRPVITGRRLDAAAPRLRADVPNGYGYGFQATGLTFPTIGCWRITGSFGKAHLTFTVLVTKGRLGP